MLLSRVILQQLSVVSLNVLLQIARILPLRVTGFLVTLMFAAVYPWLGRLRRICRHNLRSVYGSSRSREEYGRMTKDCLRHVSRGMVDMLYYAQRPEALSGILDLHQEERLQQALRQGRGVIGVTAHLGNFPLMFLALVRRGYKVNVVIRPMRDPNFSRFMFDLCAQWHIRMIPIAPAGTFLREALAALKRNEVLFILLDEFVPEESGVMVDFFNSKVSRAAGPMLFHERTGAPVLPIFIVKNKENRFDVFVEPPLEIEKRFSPTENTCRNIAALTAVIEKFVRRYPLQWGGWLNKRWASR